MSEFQSDSIGSDNKRKRNANNSTNSNSSNNYNNNNNNGGEDDFIPPLNSRLDRKATIKQAIANGEKLFTKVTVIASHAELCNSYPGNVN